MAARRMAVIWLLLCIYLCLLPCSVYAASTVDAAEPISPETECSLTLSYRCDGVGFSNISVELYRIADVSADAQYSLTSSFLPSGLVVNGIQSAGEWDVIRSTLEAHIIANAIKADNMAATDQTGQAHFDTLKPGLYLLAAEQATQEKLQCFFGSALIALPGLGTDGRWQYQMAVSPKPEVLPPITPDEEIQYKILKLWKDKHHQSKRPDSIDVEIFRNGESFETVLLSETNNWSYAWSAPVDGAVWKVVERNIPKGYSVTVEECATSFVLTNTWNPEKDDVPEDTPKTGDTSHILFYIVTVYVSGIGLILMGIAGKRKRT